MDAERRILIVMSDIQRILTDALEPLGLRNPGSLPERYQHNIRCNT